VGLLDIFALNPVATKKINAADNLVPYASGFSFVDFPSTATRAEAMQVPAVARALCVELLEAFQFTLTTKQHKLAFTVTHF
jgi:hypothetical protein